MVLLKYLLLTSNVGCTSVAHCRIRCLKFTAPGDKLDNQINMSNTMLSNDFEHCRMTNKFLPPVWPLHGM